TWHHTAERTGATISEPLPVLRAGRARPRSPASQARAPKPECPCVCPRLPVAGRRPQTIIFVHASSLTPRHRGKAPVHSVPTRTPHRRVLERTVLHPQWCVPWALLRQGC